MASIVATDTDFGSSDFEKRLVEAAGIKFTSYEDAEDRTPEAIIERLQNADGAITSYGQFTAEVFDALPHLKVVSKTGTGVDNIDVAAATKNGTAVCNVPGYGTEVVSDHAITLALDCLRRTNEIDADMRRGIWDFKRHRPLGQVKGRTFGVIGAGDIGSAAARKARGLGFDVIIWDRKGRPGERNADGIPFASFEDLLRTSDVISLHVALVPATRHLLNSENIRMLKQDAIVINTSRGAVVDLDALAEALEDGRLWGAGIDVFEHEPVPINAPIMGAPHTVLTSHAAYWSEESAVELRTRCTDNAIAVVLGRKPESCVNPEVLRQMD